MEFMDLKAQYRRLQPQMEEAVLKVLRSGNYILGQEVTELETRLAEYVKVPYCTAVSSGTDALLLALMAAGIGPGDLVITTAFSFFATSEVVGLLGGQVMFCDIHPDTYNMDPYCLEHLIKRIRKTTNLRPKAVIAVDLFGQCAEYDRIEEICQENDLVLIEDAAQSMGASIGERKAGSFGRFGCTSFFPSKPLGCYGDGGAVFCHTQEDRDLLESLRVHGKGKDKYDNLRIGLNARLDAIQAAVLLTKLPVLEEELAARRRAAAWYDEGLGKVVKTPRIKEGLTSSYAQYTIAVDAEKRDAIQTQLASQGIPTHIYYPTPLHKLPVYRTGGVQNLPNAEKAAKTVLSLPMHPDLSREEAQRVIEAVCRAVMLEDKGLEDKGDDEPHAASN